MFKRRPDGTYLKDIPAVAKIVPYFMPNRAIATIYTEYEIDITETLKFLKRFNKERDADGKVKITFFMLYMAACARAITLRPRLNRFAMGFRMWQRNVIRFSFVAKKELTDEGDEIWVALDFSPFDTLHDIGERIVDAHREATRGEGNQGEDVNVLLVKLPRFLLRFIFWLLQKLDYWGIPPKFYTDASPFHATVNLTNVGSVGVDAPFHHMLDFGTAGLFASVGTVRKEWKFDRRGNPQLRDVVKVTYAYDDRIADGIYGGRAISMVQKFVEDPETLLEVPKLTREILEEHKLKGYPPEMANA